MSKKAFIGIVALAIIFIGLAVFLLARSDRQEEANRYNNGICTECGGELHQHGSWVDRADGTTFHTFICDKCGRKLNLRFYGED